MNFRLLAFLAIVQLGALATPLPEPVDPNKVACQNGILSLMATVPKLYTSLRDLETSLIGPTDVEATKKSLDLNRQIYVDLYSVLENLDHTDEASVYFNRIRSNAGQILTNLSGLPKEVQGVSDTVAVVDSENVLSSVGNLYFPCDFKTQT